MWILLLSCVFTFAQDISIDHWDIPDWSGEVKLQPGQGRANIYQFEDPQVWNQYIEAGKRHALQYPVTVTGIVVPFAPIKRFFDGHPNPFREFFLRMGRKIPPFHSTQELYDWLGLHSYPSQIQPAAYNIPPSQYSDPQIPMGFSMMETKMGQGFTFSCATCHSADLFGVKVLGLTNRFPRANDFFWMAKDYIRHVSPTLFRLGLGATRGEAEMYWQTKKALDSVGAKKPIQLGLDTSLAQVALSLSPAIK